MQKRSKPLGWESKTLEPTPEAWDGFPVEIRGIGSSGIQPPKEARMHAVVTKVSVSEGEAATKYLREEIVPRVSQAPGLVAAYWVRLEGGDEGNSVIVLESEDAARAVAEQIRGNVGSNPGVTLNDVSVGEVVASA
jgi:hypothetical protein